MKYCMWDDDIEVSKEEFYEIFSKFNGKRSSWSGANVYTITFCNKTMDMGYQRIDNDKFYIEKMFANKHLKEI